MRLYDIWREGYRCSGNESKAEYVVTILASSFKEACRIHYSLDRDFDIERLTVWGCRLYSTEEEARASYG